MQFKGYIAYFVCFVLLVYIAYNVTTQLALSPYRKIPWADDRKALIAQLTPILYVSNPQLRNLSRSEFDMFIGCSADLLIYFFDNAHMCNRVPVLNIKSNLSNCMQTNPTVSTVLKTIPLMCLLPLTQESQ